MVEKYKSQKANLFLFRFLGFLEPAGNCHQVVVIDTNPGEVFHHGQVIIHLEVGKIDI